MGNRMLCPGCGAETSDVWHDFTEGRPCRNCGLSAEAASEIREVRARRADEQLKARVEELIKQLDSTESELRDLRSRISDITDVIERDPREQP